MIDTKRYQDWFKKGDQDIKGAHILYNHDGDLGIVCFHCQQALEKYFKGYLIYKTGLLQEGHSLIKLCKKASSYDGIFSKFIKDCAFINTFYIETRYPAEDPLVVSKEDAEECMRIVEEIINEIINIIV